MRRTAPFLMILVAIVLGLVAGPVAAEVKFERKLREETKDTSHIETTTKQILTLAGMDIETKATQFVIASSQSGKRNGDGDLPVVSQIDKLQAELSLPGGISLSFDSGNPDKKADVAQLETFLDVLRATAKSKWTSVFDKANQLKSVEFDKSLADSVDEAFKSQFDP